MGNLKEQGLRAARAFIERRYGHEIIEEGFTSDNIRFDLIAEDVDKRLHFIQVSTKQGEIPSVPQPTKTRRAKLERATMQWLKLHPEQQPAEITYDHVGIGIFAEERAMLRIYQNILSSGDVE